MRLRLRGGSITYHQANKGYRLEAEIVERHIVGCEET